MRSSLPISAALADSNLLGAALGDIASWRMWIAILKAAFAEPMDDDERARFALVAGDRAPPKKRVREIWAGPIGRRSGKSRIAGAIACHIAALTDHSKRLAPGEVGVVAVIASNREQAATVFGYIKGFLLSSPLLAGEVVSVNREEIALRGDIVISVMTNSFRSARGRTLLAVVGDEISYWRDIDSAEPDIETFRAVLPSLVASGGLWVAISTGYRRQGLLFEKHRDHFGVDSDDVLAISGPTEMFNPLIDVAAINKARAEDPEASEAEWGGGFRRDIAAFLSDHDIDAAVDFDRPMELPPRHGRKYRGFADPSGGRHDAFCIGIGHFEGTRDTGRFVLDCLRGHAPPFDPQSVVKEFAALLREYFLHEVTGDNYSAEWSASAFKDAGIKYTRAEKPKSQLYLEAQTLFSRGGIVLPNHATLLRELRLLERRTHRSGRDTVDHGARGHDDFANATLGCAALTMARGYRTSLDWVCSDAELDLHRWEQLAFNRFVMTGGML